MRSELSKNDMDKLSHEAVFGLANKNPKFSAMQVFSKGQLILIYLAVVLSLYFLMFNTIDFLVVLNYGFTLFLFFNFFFKYLLIWFGAVATKDKKITFSDIRKIENEDLPNYSIIVPMYRESLVLPFLVSNLEKLDYPKNKLDIKLVLEEDDQETISKAKEMMLPEHYEIIVVPHSLPKTKPKACNYALNFCRGDYITIYDAEDRPEPTQLKKAFTCFERSCDKLAVVQARLNYFNADENWITKMFTMEYSLWFDFFLPALDRLGFPIPLGGTSNHFDIKVLKECGGWDPFNVTEDADLGLRIYQLGKTVKVIDSTTYEEANTQFGNWIRQRSRWLKGYMQTYLVHMRDPIHLYKSVGFKGFLAFQFFIGGTFLNALIVVFLYGIFAVWILTQTIMFEPIFPDELLYLNFLNLILGNIFFIYTHMLGIYKRRLFKLIPFALMAPFYWLMLSIAGYKGFFQLLYKPFYWEKTEHGLSKHL